ncbi:MAG: cation:proton antiporter [Candidatus Omnitrophota bacterium]|nr:cation:proton antiporter [Candidatus Omnitrophota bacterium]
MNILLIIGLIMLLGMIGGRLFNKLNLPQITGYIIIGLLLGQSFHGILSGPIMDSFRPVISLALGIIGFMIGSELHLDRFKRYSRSIYTILFFEAFFTFFLVALATYAITREIYMGLMFGALASATAPAATYSVLGEYKARGPVTMTTLSIVALDDALALLIYGFVSIFARTLIVHGNFSFVSTMAVPLFQITGSILIGVLSGVALHKITMKIRDREKLLPCALGTIILVVGLSIYFKVDPILASMVLGAVVSNLQPADSREMFDLIKKLSPPIFILFFVLIGARLDARILVRGGVPLLACAYILSRSAGKLAGAYLGGKISRAKGTVTKYLGFCLFDQAGVAVGLAIAAYHTFSLLGDEARMAGLMIINIITATTFLLQLVAPPMIKFAIKRSDEVGRNVTEEDIIDSYKVKDVMDEDFFVIRENNNLHQIIDVMKKSSAYNFPVVGMDGDFLGIISLGEIRDTFYEEQMDQLILAGDIVRDVDAVAYADQALKHSVDVFDEKKLEYLPVLEKEDGRKIVGQLEYRKLMDFISKEVLLRQQELEV